MLAVEAGSQTSFCPSRPALGKTTNNQLDLRVSDLRPVVRLSMVREGARIRRKSTELEVPSPERPFVLAEGGRQMSGRQKWRRRAGRDRELCEIESWTCWPAVKAREAATRMLLSQ